MGEFLLVEDLERVGGVMDSELSAFSVDSVVDPSEWDVWDSVASAALSSPVTCSSLAPSIADSS